MLEYPELPLYPGKNTLLHSSSQKYPITGGGKCFPVGRSCLTKYYLPLSPCIGAPGQVCHALLALTWTITPDITQAVVSLHDNLGNGIRDGLPVLKIQRVKIYFKLYP